MMALSKFTPVFCLSVFTCECGVGLQLREESPPFVEKKVSGNCAPK